MGILPFDPFSHELRIVGNNEIDGTLFRKKAFALCEEMKQRNRATPDNDKFPDAVNELRKNPELTWATHRTVDGEVRRFELVGDPGANLAKELMGRHWRVSTLAEIQKELESRNTGLKEIRFKNEQEMKAKELDLATKALDLAKSFVKAETKAEKVK